MFKKHPKGLLAAMSVNMCERFGYYTMNFVLLRFLIVKLGLTDENASLIYSVFYGLIAVSGIVGGLLADRKGNFTKTILIGLILMTIGYLTLAVSTPIGVGRLGVFLSGLFAVAFGMGLFKGNLQAVVGQLYDNSNYGQMRDAGFTWFSAFINIGVLLSVFIVFDMGNWKPENANCHYLFVISLAAMLVSLTIFLLNKNKFPTAEMLEAERPKIDVKETRQRFYVLFAVFAVINLFCFAFHQDGQSLSLFARDYCYFKSDFRRIEPIFFVLLTPVVLAIFSRLRTKSKEPSTIKKITIGMGIAACAYIVMALGTITFPDVQFVRDSVGEFPDAQRATALFIGTYFILTLAKLFFSPLLTSFVSKVTPPKRQGLMQNLLFCAGAIGNLFLFQGVILYNRIPLWATWTIFAVICLISLCIMLLILKWVERLVK